MSFDTIAGSVLGRDHVRARRNGQDAYAVIATPALTTLVVTDGCSSGAASEIGARLGAVWLALLVQEHFPADDAALGVAKVARGLEDRLARLARSLSANDAIESSVVGELLLFGYLVAVISDDNALVFGAGDGIVWVDGKQSAIDPGPENAPPYPAYALLGDAPPPRIHHLGPCERLAIATDGAEDSLGDIVLDDRLFKNPSLLKKRLNVLTEGGACFDDTTIAIARRRS